MYFKKQVKIYKIIWIAYSNSAIALESFMDS